MRARDASSLVNSCIFFVKVLRDGRWSEEDAAILVPGDVISIKLRDIVPTDACILEGDPLKIDQVGIQIAIFVCSVHVGLVAFCSYY